MLPDGTIPGSLADLLAAFRSCFTAPAHRSRPRWYTTKTEPSYGDMAIKLHRVIIAARFRNPRPELVTPQETPGGPRSLGSSRT